MGWFSSSPREPAAAGAAEEAGGKAPAAAKAKATIAEPTWTEAEQLDQLVGGVRLDDSAANDKIAFLGSNTRHMYVDGFLSCAAYTFSGLQHIQGQSNALTLLTMWTVGTTFLVDAGERKHLSDVLRGTLPTTVQKGGSDAATSPEQGSKAGAASESAARTVADPASPTMASPPFFNAAKIAEQQRKIFLTQAVASWVWMLASFQQFKMHKRLKWCGYSSWMGLGCVSYYTTRHVYNLLVA